MTDVLYENTVDKQAFRVKVTRLEDYKGRLVVTVEENQQVLLDEEVGLSFGAMFGPDVADVAEWQDKAIEAIDAHLANKRE